MSINNKFTGNTEAYPNMSAPLNYDRLFEADDQQPELLPPLELDDSIGDIDLEPLDDDPVDLYYGDWQDDQPEWMQ